MIQSIEVLSQFTYEKFWLASKLRKMGGWVFDLVHYCVMPRKENEIEKPCFINNEHQIPFRNGLRRPKLSWEVQLFCIALIQKKGHLHPFPKTSTIGCGSLCVVWRNGWKRWNLLDGWWQTKSGKVRVEVEWRHPQTVSSLLNSHILRMKKTTHSLVEHECIQDMTPADHPAIWRSPGCILRILN